MRKKILQGQGQMLILMVAGPTTQLGPRAAACAVGCVWIPAGPAAAAADDDDLAGPSCRWGWVEEGSWEMRETGQLWQWQVLMGEPALDLCVLMGLPVVLNLTLLG